MFDIGWSELLVIGIVALIVVGPKDLPILLRTIGKYVGMIRRQAGEFRAQFDEAMRESELEQLKQEVTKLKSEAEGTLKSAERSVSDEFASARSALDDAALPSSSPVAAQGHADAPLAQPPGAQSAAAAAAAAVAAAGPPQDAISGAPIVHGNGTVEHASKTGA